MLFTAPVPRGAAAKAPLAMTASLGAAAPPPTSVSLQLQRLFGQFQWCMWLLASGSPWPPPLGPCPGRKRSRVCTISWGLTAPQQPDSSARGESVPSCFDLANKPLKVNAQQFGPVNAAGADSCPRARTWVRSHPLRPPTAACELGGRGKAGGSCFCCRGPA